MTTYRTTKRGHRIQIGAPADSDGDGFSGPYVGIVDPMAGAGFPISRPSKRPVRGCSAVPRRPTEG